MSAGVADDLRAAMRKARLHIEAALHDFQAEAGHGAALNVSVEWIDATTIDGPRVVPVVSVECRLILEGSR